MVVWPADRISDATAGPVVAEAGGRSFSTIFSIAFIASPELRPGAMRADDLDRGEAL
jgi:hypothetical protein